MDKRLIKMGGVTLGAGRPAVCVPVMGESLEAIERAAGDAKAAGAEIIELRADSLSPMPDVRLAGAMCAAVRRAAPDTALLFTLRTARDGGPGDADPEAYEALLCALAGSAPCDAVDVEMSVGEAAFSRIVSSAHAAGLAVVGSSHDFTATPAEDAIVSTLLDMRRLGADVSKIAVMPQNRLDVLTLMRAAVRADEQLDTPLIAIAMGRLGVTTRLCGEAIGSCLTFGTAGRASAPGQIDARTLRDTLETIHAAL